MEHQASVEHDRKRKAGGSRFGGLALALLLVPVLAVGFLVYGKVSGPSRSAADMWTLRTIDAWPDPRPVTSVTAMTLMQRFFAGATMITMKVEKFHGQPVYTIETDQGRVSVLAKTGHYWLDSEALSGFFAPDGTRLTDTGG